VPANVDPAPQRKWRPQPLTPNIRASLFFLDVGVAVAAQRHQHPLPDRHRVRPHGKRLRHIGAAADGFCSICQRRHNLLPKLRALVVQDFAVDLLSDPPKQKHCGAVRLTREHAARFLDQTGH
jgi:hypothetical protein